MAAQLAAQKTLTARNSETRPFQNSWISIRFSLTKFKFTVCPKSQEYPKSYLSNSTLPTTNLPNALARWCGVSLKSFHPLNGSWVRWWWMNLFRGMPSCAPAALWVSSSCLGKGQSLPRNRLPFCEPKIHTLECVLVQVGSWSLHAFVHIHNVIMCNSKHLIGINIKNTTFYSNDARSKYQKILMALMVGSKHTHLLPSTPSTIMNHLIDLG